MSSFYEVTACGVTWEVEGDYIPGEPMTQDSPEIPPDFDIEEVYAAGSEEPIQDFLTETVLKEIRAACLVAAFEEYNDGPLDED